MIFRFLKSICSCIGKYNSWLEGTSFFGSHASVTHYDYYIAFMNLTCCCSIQTYHTRAGLSRYSVCVKTFAVIVVHYEYSFTGEYVGRFEQ